jgi:hypothetical protein
LEKLEVELDAARSILVTMKKDGNEYLIEATEMAINDLEKKKADLQRKPLEIANPYDDWLRKDAKKSNWYEKTVKRTDAKLTMAQMRAQLKKLNEANAAKKLKIAEQAVSSAEAAAAEKAREWQRMGEEIKAAELEAVRLAKIEMGLAGQAP